VDTSEAGFGDLDVSVTQGGVGVPVKRNQVSRDLARYCFAVKLPKVHLIQITFNGECVPGQWLAAFVSVSIFETGYSTRFNGYVLIGCF